ncbi:MAG: type I-B CRISPR-associated endonuclease Cas1b [Promethearchaeati archaeon SRVP18_Atabeyarchaeia-1]
MKEPLYITSEGILIRSGNTLYFMNKEGKKALPIENISEIYCYGKVSLRSGASSLLMKMGVPTHFFNKYGYYEGSLYPRIQLNSGLVVVKQAEHYLDAGKRADIAREIVEGVKHNVLQTLKYYRKRKKDVDPFIEAIEKESILGDIPTVMSAEGRIWAAYYQSFGEIINTFEMKEREIRPPTSEMNSLISFGNSLLYSTALSEIYNTYLHPSISYLHEPSERRFSLALDFADIFKPVIVERVIFTLVNNKMLTDEDFDREIGVLLKDKGKKLFLKEYQEKLSTTLNHPDLNRKVSYKYLIRLECYKLIKHILGDKKYNSFKMWW